jgi:hypothetical protein
VVGLLVGEKNGSAVGMTLNTALIDAVSVAIKKLRKLESQSDPL